MTDPRELYRIEMAKRVAQREPEQERVDCAIREAARELNATAEDRRRGGRPKKSVNLHIPTTKERQSEVFT